MSTDEKRINSTEVASDLKEHILGKVVLITGTSPNGLGAETARAIATQNPGLIILCGRSRSAIEDTERTIKAQFPSAPTRLLIFDLASLASVRQAAAEINGYPERIDVVINNAVIMASPYTKTIDGFESQFAVNHLGHFLLTNLILKKPLHSGLRIVNVTSNGYAFGGVRFADPNFEQSPYDKWAAYAQSKTANILFSIALAKRLGSKGVYSYSVEVGDAIYTNISKFMTEEDFALMGGVAIPVITAAEGTATQVVAAFDPSLGEGRGANGAFMENGRVLATKPECPWTRGAENADSLWELSEKMVGETFAW